MTPQIPFKRNVVEPVRCIKNGWALIKDQYWLFVGMGFVAMLIGQAVPLGILFGPMMCGLYLTFLMRRRGEPTEFATLFKGFDFFGPSLIATLLLVVPILMIIIPMYFLFYISLFASLLAMGNDPNPAAVLGVFGLFGFFIIIVIVVISLISLGFMFSYPLIVDRKLQGFEAVKLSFKGALANFWRLVGLSLLMSLLSMAGMLFCFVGMYLVLPVIHAAVVSAYEQVFGLANPNENYANLPPPPPVFN